MNIQRGDERISIDLSTVERCNRTATWVGIAPVISPGLSVKCNAPEPAEGRLKNIALGNGALWIVRSPPVIVQYEVVERRQECLEYISLFLQADGRTVIEHSNRIIRLNKGYLCIVDESKGFSISSHSTSEMVIIKIPKMIMKREIPNIENYSALTLDESSNSSCLLREVIFSVVKNAHGVSDLSKPLVLSAIMKILSASLLGAAPVDCRVEDILRYIHLNYCDDLDAEKVARIFGISRRRLDQLLMEKVGVPASRIIWSRRLENAHADLLDPAKSHLTITEISFNNGFQDSAHFCRVFKKKFGESPNRWRLLNGSLIN